MFVTAHATDSVDHRDHSSRPRIRSRDHPIPAVRCGCLRLPAPAQRRATDSGMLPLWGLFLSRINIPFVDRLIDQGGWWQERSRTRPGTRGDGKKPQGQGGFPRASPGRGEGRAHQENKVSVKQIKTGCRTEVDRQTNPYFYCALVITVPSQNNVDLR